MSRTRPVLVDGDYLGAVLSLAEGWSFIATDPVVADLHGHLFPSLEEAIRIAGLVRNRARTAPSSLPVLRPPPVLHLVRDEDVADQDVGDVGATHRGTTPQPDHSREDKTA